MVGNLQIETKYKENSTNITSRISSELIGQSQWLANVVTFNWFSLSSVQYPMFMGGESVLFLRIPTNSLNNGVTLCFASSQKQILGQFTSQLFLFASCMLRVMPFTSVSIGGFSLHPKRSNSYNKTAKKLQPTLSCLAEIACKSLWTHLLHVSFKGGKQDTTMTAQNKVPLIWKEKSHPTRFRELSIDTIEIKSDLCFPLILMKSSQICVLWGLVLRPITMQLLALNPSSNLSSDCILSKLMQSKDSPHC